MPAEYPQIKTEALSTLREVAELAETSGAETLARRLREDRIARLQADRFHLVVLGEFNHGKTTFVNALLGESVLPAGVTPTTAVIHHLMWGERPAAVAVKRDGSRRELSMAELGRYGVGSTEAAELERIEVFHPAPLLEDGVVLVDTPGVNDLNEARAEITYGYIPRADAILFLLDAGQILKESERGFVSGKLLAGVRDKVLFLINKLDLLDDREREEALAYAKATLEKIVPSPRLYGLSARLGLGEDRARSGLDPFVADLKTFLQEERGRVVIDNALEVGLRTAQTLRTGVEVQRRALTMEQAEVERRLEALEAELARSSEALPERQARVREALAGVKALVREDVEGFGRRFAAALPAEIQGSETKDLRRYLGGFVEEKFREFAESEAEQVAARLEKVAEDAIAFVAEDARSQASRLQEALGPSAPKLDFNVNTFAYDVGVFALGAFGLTLMMLSNVIVGGALAASAPVVAWLLKGRVDKRVRERAAEEAPKTVIEAASRMADAFDERIDEFGERLIEFVTRANEEMTRSMAELVRRARDARRDGDRAIGQLDSDAGQALVRLRECEQRIEGIRGRLWGNGRGRTAGAA